MRSPPELAAVADGMKKNYSGGRFATGTGFPDLGKRRLPAGEATQSRSSGLAAVGPAREIA